jgi:histidinol-phosphate aminotransferase
MPSDNRWAIAGQQNFRMDNDTKTLLDRFRPAVKAQKVYSVRSYEGLEAKLNQNESPFDLPALLKNEIVSRLQASCWNRYPTDYADTVREALARRLDVSADMVLLSNGSNDLIYSMAGALVDPGTPVVLPEPLFSLYEKAVHLQNGLIVAVPCREGLHLDIDALIEAARRHDAPLIAVTNPGSPTGSWTGPDEMERLVARAPGFVLIDEAYHEFVEGTTALELLGRHPNVLVMRTFSKAMGLAGLRIGYLVARPEILAEIRKVRLPFVLNALSEAAALVVLEHTEYITEFVLQIRRGREGLYRSLRLRPDVTLAPSSTNFLIFKTPLPSSRLVEALAREGILIRDIGGYPGLAGYVRVTIGSPGENQAFLVALKHVLDEA